MRARIVLALGLTLCAPALCISPLAQVVSPRVVLTIHLGPETFPSNPVLDAGIRKALASRPDVPVDYFAEDFESDVFPEAQASPAFADYIRRKYRGRTIDVVIVNADEALRFVLDHREELFPHAPIVFSGVGVPDDRSSGAGLTGIKVGVAYSQTVKLALELQPAIRRVFVVANGAGDRARQSVRAELSTVPGRVSIEYLDGSTVAALLSAVKAVPPESVILYIWHHPKAELGNLVYADEVARLVAQASPVPVYGTSDFYFGTGVVGGVVRRTGQTGTRLGEIALRILTGTRPQDIPFEDAQVGPVVDWRQVERWGLTSRLPADAQVLFREPSAWERYKVYIIGVAAALLIQAALIMGLFIQWGRRRSVELRLRRSELALRQSYERVRNLGARLLNAQEGERSRIARELHDDISQQLAILKFKLALLRPTSQGRNEAVVADAAKRADDIAASVHDLSHRLHPARLQLMGLVPALDGLRRELSHPGVTVTFTHDDVPTTLPPDLMLCLFRVVQEALHNALKYSKAQTVSVDLRTRSGGIALTIADDGVGFDVEAAWGRGIGLISLSERVEAIGATLDIRSSPGSGTTLNVWVPESALQNVTPVAV